MSRVTVSAQRKRRRSGSQQRYLMRCPALDAAQWEPFTGPASLALAVRIKTERMDADAAFPVALGGKTAVVEVRRDGSPEIFRFEVTGLALPRYEVQPLDEDAAAAVSGWGEEPDEEAGPAPVFYSAGELPARAA